MTKNSRSQLNHQIVLQSVILVNSVLIWVGALLLRSKYPKLWNSIPLKKASDILILPIPNKCQFVTGKNSDIPNNFMWSSMEYSTSMPKTKDCQESWMKMMRRNYSKWQMIGKTTKLILKVKNLRLNKLMRI